MERSRDVFVDQDIDFSTLIQNEQLLRGLEHSGYARPSPIQLQAIPLGRLGVDLVAQAKSGTGKTVVFGVIALESINPLIPQPQALIVAPTREIAIQIRDVLRNLGKYIEGFQCEALIGGLSTQGDYTKLKNSQVLVGTPGRLMALLDSKRLNPKTIKLMVLDEADKLMSEAFQPQINFIFRKLPATKQCIAFSATFTDNLLESLGTLMKSPQKVRLTETVPTLDEVQQYYKQVIIPKEISQNEALAILRSYEAKFEAVGDVLSKIPFYQAMIFVNSVPRAIELSGWLTEMGWKSGHISSSLSQEQRISVMENMRDFKLRVLVCSDLIARGIDIDRVNLVVNIDYPWEIETYLHRVGRTGRFGTSGIALNLVGPEDELFLDRLRETGIVVNPLPDNVSYSNYRKELTESEQERLERHQSQRANKQDEPLVFQKVAKRRADNKIKSQASKRNKTQSSVSCAKKSRDPVSSQNPVTAKVQRKEAVKKETTREKIVKKVDSVKAQKVSKSQQKQRPLPPPQIIMPTHVWNTVQTAPQTQPVQQTYSTFTPPMMRATSTTHNTNHTHQHPFLPTMAPLFFPNKVVYASPKHFTPPDLYF